MVISFSVREAREQLLNLGEVYTFRWRRRSFFEKEKGDVESTWANAKRGGKRIDYVDIEEVGEFSCDDSLLPYSNKSGFDKIWKWQNKIMNIGMPVLNSKGWLYKATLKRSNGSADK